MRQRYAERTGQPDRTAEVASHGEGAVNSGMYSGVDSVWAFLCPRLRLRLRLRFRLRLRLRLSFQIRVRIHPRRHLRLGAQSLVLLKMVSKNCCALIAYTKHT